MAYRENSSEELILRLIRLEREQNFNQISSFIEDFGGLEQQNTDLSALLASLCLSGELEKIGDIFRIPKPAARAGHFEIEDEDGELVGGSEWGPSVCPSDEPVMTHSPQAAMPKTFLNTRGKKKEGDEWGSATALTTAVSKLSVGEPRVKAKGRPRWTSEKATPRTTVPRELLEPGPPFAVSELPDDARRPHSVAIVQDAKGGDRLWIAALTGIFRTDLTGKKLALGGDVVTGFCIDFAYWAAEKKIVAFMGSSADRKGSKHTSHILIFDEEEPLSKPLSIPASSWLPSLGRPRKVALSEAGRKLFVSVKHEDPKLRPLPASSVLCFRLSELMEGKVNAKKIVDRCPANIFPIAVSDESKLLAAADRTDCDLDNKGSIHSVEIFDFKGNFLRVIADGGANSVLKLGFVTFPRALCFTEDGNWILVVDELKRVQRFSAKEEIKEDRSESATVILQDVDLETLNRNPKYLQDLKALQVQGSTCVVVGYGTIKSVLSKNLLYSVNLPI